MRIAYVLTTLGMGGAERQAVMLADRMAARGHAVALLILGPPAAQQWPTTLPVFHLDLRKSAVSLLAASARARRFLRDFNPTLVHSHTFHANIFARLLRPWIAAPVLSTVHNVYEGGWPRMLAYRLTDRLSCATAGVSQAVVDRYVSLKAVPGDKCLAMANGIDAAEFAPSLERRESLRAGSSAHGEFLWLTVGRIAPSKDYPNLLRAFALACAEFPNARLWIAGEAGPAENSAMRVLATELGIGQAVRWLGLRRDLPALLDLADAFVLASAWEGMPLAVAEAMSMEKPVVATSVGGVTELVGECGLVVPPRNPAALASAMTSVMQSAADARRALGRAARQRILKNHSIDARCDEWEALYRRLTSAR